MTTGALLLLQQTPAMAVLVDGNPGARDPDHFEHITDDMNCVGGSALQSATFTVDAVPVADFIGKVTPESKVTATFELADGCDDTKLGLATYNTISQKLMDQQTGTFGAGALYVLTLSVPRCDFEIDFFTGDLLNQLQPNVGYSTPINRLIATGKGGEKACDVLPSAVTTSSTTTAPTTSTTSTTFIGHQQTPISPPVDGTEDPSLMKSATTSVNVDVQVEAVVLARDDPQSTNENLARTGSDAWELAAIGTSLLTVGIVLLVLAYRHRKHNA
jgi:hypothetical protein